MICKCRFCQVLSYIWSYIQVSSWAATPWYSVLGGQCLWCKKNILVQIEEGKRPPLFDLFLFVCRNQCYLATRELMFSWLNCLHLCLVLIIFGTWKVSLRFSLGLNIMCKFKVNSNSFGDQIRVSQLQLCDPMILCSFPSKCQLEMVLRDVFF